MDTVYLLKYTYTPTCQKYPSLLMIGIISKILSNIQIKFVQKLY